MKKNMKKNILVGIFILSILALIKIIFDADSGTKNFLISFIGKIPNGDKIGHFFIFGFLALILNIILDFKKINFLKYKLFLGSFLIFFIASAEEFSQKFYIYRTFDFLDLLADFLGIFILSFLFLKIKNNIKK